ncbi:hypothetical protein JXL83_06025 [candidate division WOR-3 bacterium]|nr:hypothetical protein [candidate division WOR-3 bacterium]
MKYIEIKKLIDGLENREKGMMRYFEPNLTGLRNVAASMSMRKRKTVKVVGTNGKGSVCAILTSILAESGLKTVTFTSPHLVNELERIRINGTDVPEEIFYPAISKVFRYAGKFLTYFEAMFLTALTVAEDEDADVLILEAGMGGKLDATNAVECDVFCCTSISIDHSDVLGETVFQIALDKAGGMSPGCDVVLDLKKPLRDLFELRASLNGSRFFPADDLIEKVSGRCSGEGILFNCRNFGEVFVPLKGMFQIENIKLALAIIERLKSEFKIETRHVLIGAEKTVHLGRLHYVGRNPLKIIDGSHNVNGVRETVKFLSDTHGGLKFSVFFSAMRDKDYLGMIEALDSVAGVFYASGITDRILKKQEYEEAFNRIGRKFNYLERDEFITEFIKNKDDSIAVGSLRTAGEILKALT